MSEDEKDEGREKGFVVRDKRFSVKKEAEEESLAKEKEKVDEPIKKDKGQESPLPEISFTNLLFSLSTSALIQLGEIQDPVTQQSSKNIPLAKQTIDLLGMLREKTKGNLTADEEKFLESILYDLRMRYVRAAS
jgi:hypothetical protein